MFFKAPLVNLAGKQAIPEPILPLEQYNAYKYTYLTNPDIKEMSNEEIILNMVRELDNV